MSASIRCRLSSTWWLLALALTPTLSAQDLPGLGNPFGGGLGGFGASAEPEVTYDASLEGIEGTTTGTLSVKATIQPGWHTFSITNPSGGSVPTSFALPAGLTAGGSWTADRDPEIHFVDVFGVDQEEFKGEVIWSVPVRWEAGTDPASLGQVQVTGQACTDADGACVATDASVAIRFVGFAAPATVAGDFRPADAHVIWRGEVVPATIRAGETFEVRLTAEPTDGFHIYGWSEKSNPKAISADTLFAFTKRNGWSVAAPVANPEPQIEETGLKIQPTNRVHHGPVTWSMTFRAPNDVPPGEQRFEGLVGYQTCSDQTCDLPMGAKFSFAVTVGEQGGSEAGTVAFVAYAPSSGDAYKEIAKGADAASWGLAEAAGPEIKQAAPIGTILYWVGISFIAGLVLNVMPCVLPVIGLKIMSLVSQAGSSRFQIFHLNLWLSIGIISVFLVLATLAVGFGMAWSEQFTNPWFVVVLTSVVFVFGLSFFGVWEIPIPGFAGSSGASKLAEREGAIGAFFKGALSTVLATPCAGPVMVPALAFAISQPPVIAYGMFAAMGIGMASPYLLIGLVPATIRWLPKPGDWMLTFKELMGFAMLATVVFLVSILQDDMRIPMGTLLVVLGFACWWIGRIPMTAEAGKYVGGWVVAILIVAAGGFGAFRFLGPAPEQSLAWVKYEPAALEQFLTEKKQPVFLDFTANWCVTCKVNEGRALNIAETKALFAEHKIVAMKADKTVKSPEIDRILEELGNTGKAIPFYAVFVPGSDKPVVFDGLISHDTVRAKLAEAGLPIDGAAAAAARVSTEQGRLAEILP